MAAFFERTLLRQIKDEDSLRGVLVRRAALLAENATEAEQALLEEALCEVLERLGALEGEVAP